MTRSPTRVAAETNGRWARHCDSELKVTEAIRSPIWASVSRLISGLTKCSRAPGHSMSTSLSSNGELHAKPSTRAATVRRTGASAFALGE